MSDYIDSKYLNLLSARLRNFKRKTDTLWNFSCPYCGDSQKNKTKARGYVFLKEGTHIFKCHNCGQGASLQNLIKFVDPELHRQFVMERFTDKTRANPTPAKTKTDLRLQRKPEYLKNTPLKNLKKVSQLAQDHPVRKYVNKRKIPTNQHYRLFYAPKFYKFCNECIPNKFNLEEVKDEPRLVIPFIDSQGKLIGFQGRAFGKSQPKYITIMLEEDAPKIFGMDTVDWSKPVVVVEGPIDSMFLHNAIAMAGADAARLTGEVVYCYDNEPRSKEIIRRMEKVIDNGFPVVIFPNTIEEKDINDMILCGRDPEEVQAIISSNTFKGLMAKAKLSEWRKV